MNLYKSGKSISMSTRSGEFYPIQELVDDIGRDATKFFLPSKEKKNSILNSMLTRQEKKTKNNPIYYIQYAHARITKILRNFDDERVSEENYDNLKSKNEIEILGIIDKYQETLNKAIFEIRPDVITNYLYKLSKVFHSYYAETKILTDEVRGERIKLVQCIDKIILSGLNVLDIKPMDSM